MPRLRDFPPKFDRSLPAISEKPLASFFSCVRQFLDRPQKLDYSVRENVNIFNESLTRAIHEDISSVKKRLIEIRSAFESVEKALEFRVDIYEFFNDFDKFAYWCLGRNFKWDKFQDYVRSIKKKIGVFQELQRKSCDPLKTPLTWPTPDRIKYVNNIGDVNEKFNKDWIEIDHTTEPEMKTQAITNFQLAIQVINIMDREVICPLFDELLEWLKKNKTCLHHYTELEKKKLQLVSRMITKKAEYVKELHILKKCNTLRHRDLAITAQRSTETVSTAVKYYPELVASYRRMFEMHMFGLYDHYLKLLKNFNSNLETIFFVCQDANTASECEKAKDACQVWIDALDLRMKLLLSKPLEHVPKNLPKLPKFITYFTFKYYSL